MRAAFATIMLCPLLCPLLCSLLAGAALAQGCGPTRLKVSESITLPLPPAKAWALVGDFQDMSWDRDTVATSGSGGIAPDGAVRKVRLRDGSVLGDSLYKYDAAAMSYSYHTDTLDVTKLPVQNLSATIEVLPGEGGEGSVIRWRGAFYRYLKPNEGAPDMADRAAREAVETFFRSGLAGLKTKADAKT